MPFCCPDCNAESLAPCVVILPLHLHRWRLVPGSSTSLESIFPLLPQEKKAYFILPPLHLHRWRLVPGSSTSSCPNLSFHHRLILIVLLPLLPPPEKLTLMSASWFTWGASTHRRLPGGAHFESPALRAVYEANTVICLTMVARCV
jgi:hypothetical protein